LTLPRRLQDIPGFSIDRVAAAAGNDPEVLRMENLDTDLKPPRAAIEATRLALDSKEANSYLPFTGRLDLRAAIADRLQRQTNYAYGPEHVVITCGGTEATLDVLLALTDPGEEVILTDPCYAGTIMRVRLAGAVPKFLPWLEDSKGWRLDLDALERERTPATKVLLLMNPSMPTGGFMDADDWDRIARICRDYSLWLVYIAAMERILFRGLPVLHPAALDGMAERTITIGSVSKEFRMIGWRIGWAVVPPAVISNVVRVHLYNVVTPPGVTQVGAAAAFQTPDDDFERCRAEWQRRHDTLLSELSGYPVVPAAGGWSVLMNVHKLGLDAENASDRLLRLGRVAATPMTHWGEQIAPQHVRLVFRNEPIARLRSLGDRVRRALG